MKLTADHTRIAVSVTAYDGKLVEDTRNRVYTMTDKALRRLIQKIKHPEKMRAFIYVLEDENLHSLAREARKHADELGIEHPGDY